MKSISLDLRTHPRSQEIKRRGCVIAASKGHPTRTASLSKLHANCPKNSTKDLKTF